MKFKYLAFAPILLLAGYFLTDNSADQDSIRKEKPFTVAFYNLENLFDTLDDPLIDDSEFLPAGANHWGGKEFRGKLANMAKVISKLGDDDGPEILGLCEVENLYVLQQLVAMPALKKHKYKIVHHDSPDTRGIDCALLYKESAFSYLYDASYPVTLPGQPDWKTRDILLIKGIAAKRYELTLMVNHWPSRRGGAEESEGKRIRAAATARAVVDSIVAMNRDVNIIMMGDFNDEPDNKSIKDTLRASFDVKGSFFTYLFNTGYDTFKAGHGSLMYNKQWDLFDQIIVSDALTRESSELRYKPGSFAIYNPEWMQVAEGDWKDAPRRSILKNKFQPDGYSDHFPTYIQLLVKK